jgi:hypothetical protein
LGGDDREWCEEYATLSGFAAVGQLSVETFHMSVLHMFIIGSAFPCASVIKVSWFSVQVLEEAIGTNQQRGLRKRLTLLFSRLEQSTALYERSQS